MKQTILTFFLPILLLPFLSLAQEKKGDKYYNSYEYSIAANYYKRAYDQKPSAEVAFKLAECYRLSNRYDEALIYYKELSTNFPEETFYYIPYGLCLKTVEDYEAARIVFRKYLDRYPDTDETEDVLGLIRSCDIIDTLKYNRLSVTVENVNVNSELNDFSPVIFGNDLVFCSSRKESGLEREYGLDEQGYINLYRASYVTDTEFEAPVPFEEPINTSLHEGPSIYSKKYKTLFVTRNNLTYDKKENKYKNHLKIYYSNWDGETFEEPKPFQYNSEEFSVGHPAIPPSGKVFYFISDKPGGVGETDVYMCRLTSSGWSKPVNLGRPVNTTGKEMFLYAPNDTVLYFASDRQVGIGGLDIYRASIRRGRASNVTNLGSPINSPFDDFGIYLRDADGKAGYFSSNRVNFTDDIYSFKKVQLVINCLVVDSLTYNQIPNADLRIVPRDGIAFNRRTAQNGKTKLELPPNTVYDVVVSKEGYTPKKFSFDVSDLMTAKDTTLVVELSKGQSNELKGLVVDKKTRLPIAGADVTLLADDGSYDEDIKANDKAQFKFKGLEPIPYTIKASSYGYFRKGVKVENGKTHKGKVIIELIKVRTDTALNIENIVYDFDKSDITPRAAETLDKVYEIMVDNPSFVIELGSHTDQRGSDAYNEKLSLRRAESAFDYLVAKGIDRLRLQYKYYGKTKLAFPCPEGEECDDAWHERNRRTEFFIVSY